MPNSKQKYSIEEIEKIHPDLVREARGAIGLAESYPVKGGDIVPKKSGGWYEALRNRRTHNEKKSIDQ